jgi:hypothetical protein
MERMQEAWILQPGSKKRKAGFIRASDLREEELASVMFDIRQQEDD